MNLCVECLCLKFSTRMNLGAGHQSHGDLDCLFVSFDRAVSTLEIALSRVYILS